MSRLTTSSLAVQVDEQTISFFVGGGILRSGQNLYSLRLISCHDYAAEVDLYCLSASIRSVTK